jgi:acyl-CoA thioester hydrolase
MADRTSSAPIPALPDLHDRAVYVAWGRDIVRYSDLDPNGHVNNGAINMFFEDGRVAFRDQRMALGGKALLTGFAVKKFSVTYHAALGYPATVETGTVVTRVGRSSFELGQGVFANGRCIATAEVVQVYFDPATGKSAPLPDPVRAALEGTLAKD